jgi:hypothetical protein
VHVAGDRHHLTLAPNIAGPTALERSDREADDLRWRYSETVSALPASRRLGLALLVWLAVLGLDFVLNGAVFAGLYTRQDPFLLAPLDAARRIPLGYAAFAVVAIGAVELASRLRLAGWRSGGRVGAVTGAGLGLVWSVSLLSITTIDVQTAVAFFVIWAAVVTGAVAVAAWGLGARSLRGLAARVLVFDVLCVLAVVVVQSAGMVPTTRI